MFYFSVNFSHLLLFFSLLHSEIFTLLFDLLGFTLLSHFYIFLTFLRLASYETQTLSDSYGYFLPLLFVVRERQYLVPYGRNTKNYAAFCVSLAPAKNLRNLKILIFFIYVPDG